MTLAIGLLIVAFALVVLEMSFPSFGLLGLGAATAYAFATIYAFDEGTVFGWGFVGAGIVLTPVACAVGLRWLPYSPLGRHLLLRAPSEDEVQQGTLPAEKLASLVGQEGEAVSELRPAGTAKINGRRIDVVSTGAFIERGQKVVVLQTSGARVVVRAVTE